MRIDGLNCLACVYFFSLLLLVSQFLYKAQRRQFHAAPEVCVVVVVVVVDIEAWLERIPSSSLLVIIIVVLVMCELICALDCSTEPTSGACSDSRESEKNAPGSTLLMLEVDEAGLGVSAALLDWVGDVTLKLTECRNL